LRRRGVGDDVVVVCYGKMGLGFRCEDF